MRFGVLGTGHVGRTLGARLVQLGHEVAMGSRRRGNEAAVTWARTAGPSSREGTFAEAAGFGEVVVNATAGVASLEALRAAGEENLDGKVLIEVANGLDFSRGFPPQLAVCNTDSLGEQIQRAFPRARVVKTLNTVNADVMVEPALIPGSHTIFLSGDDAAAKQQVAALLRSFGWSAADILDLGGIATARGPEMLLALWLRVFGALGTGHFNFHLVRAG